MPSTYELIKGETLVSSTTLYTFSAIPSTYTDLCIKITGRTDYSNLNDTLSMIINNNTSSVYSRTWLSGDGSTTQTANISASQPLNGRYDIDGSTATANTFSNTEIYIPNYSIAAIKAISWSSAMENNSSTAYMNVLAGYINSAVAITSIKFSLTSGSNFIAGSSFRLYGIKNS